MDFMEKVSSQRQLVQDVLRVLAIDATVICIATDF
jgi:hypothetical protein